MSNGNAGGNEAAYNYLNSEDIAAQALACGANIEGAAHRAGVSERAVRDMLRRTDFKRRIEAIKGQMMSRTSNALTAAGTESVRNLILLTQDNHPSSVRHAACRTLLEMGLRYREVEEFEGRLKRLEAAYLEPEPDTLGGFERSNRANVTNPDEN